MDKVSDPWAEYARIQRQANTPILSDRAWASDETLAAILDRLEQGQVSLPQQVDNLAANRATKHRRRRGSLAKNAQLLSLATANDDSRLEALCDLDRYRRQCTTREWRILIAVGLGHTYGYIASAEAVPEATVKTWVRRVRLKLAA